MACSGRYRNSTPTHQAATGMPFPRTTVALICLIAAGPGAGADIFTTGVWSPQITTSTDRGMPIDSAETSLFITVDVAEAAPWTVWFQTQNASLSDGLRLSIKRVSNGSGTGSISGGTDYVVVDSSAQIMFTGTGDRQDVGVQMRLNGVAGGQPAPGYYGASVLYSLDTY
jgi:hypothetical protein